MFGHVRLKTKIHFANCALESLVDRDARKPVSKDGGNGPERKRKPKDISASVHITHDDGDDLVELENRSVYLGLA